MPNMPGSASKSAQKPAVRTAGRPRGSLGSREKFDQRRFEVLTAAARTFNRKGFQLATLEDVADELGVTKPALYYYARSKDELLFACGELALAALKDALSQSDEDTPGLERLRHFFRAYGTMICEDFGRCLVQTQPRDFESKTRQRNVAGRRAINQAVRRMITDGIKDGSIRRCDDRILAMAMFDAFNGLARWFDPKGPMTLKAVIDALFDAFFAGVAVR